MTDYQIQQNTRRCAVSGRELQPGERFYSVLIDAEGKFSRLDYGHESWQGPPPGAFSFWTGRVPSPENPRRPRIDDDTLFECFQRLEEAGEPSRLNFRYVVALLLMRRKRLRFEESKVEDGHEVMYLHDQRNKAMHAVVNPRMTDEEIVAVQEEVFKILGWS